MSPSTTAVPAWHRHLPAISDVQAAAGRLVFDAAFQRWLRDLLDSPALAVRTGSAAPALVLALQHDAGELTLAVDPGAWPALQAAAGLEDEATAEAVLTVLAQPLLARLPEALRDCRLRPRRGAGLRAAATLALPAGDVALLGCSPALARRVRGHCPAPDGRALAPWTALRLHGRVCLLQRLWPAAVLATLAAGDLVLPADGPPAALRWRLGAGRCLAARVALDFQTQVLQMIETPTLQAEDPPADIDGAAAGWAALQLPVSFELDTARVSLAELAGLRAGCTLELEQPLAEARVRLVCQGQTLGAGQLVAVGERLGVRITQMGLSDAGAALS